MKFTTAKQKITPKLTRQSARFIANLTEADIVVTSVQSRKLAGYHMITCMAQHQSHNFKLIRSAIKELKKDPTSNVRHDKRVFAA